jgi:type II secretory pathway pseudopilin PulG
MIKMKIPKLIIRKCKKEITQKRRGMYLPAILIASVIFMTFAAALISISLSNLKVADLQNDKITATEISEAGINYYMWHLSHNNLDFCDGQTCPGSSPYGPFTHTYSDQSGTTIGTYDLYITPPTTGNSIVTVKSVGKVSGKKLSKTIISTIGMPSFAKYTLLTNNSELWIGSGEKVNGSVFVNKSGMRNDGEITGDASSTESTYYSDYFKQTLPGVNGAGIFGGAKNFPLPAIDFNQVSVNMRTIRDNAKNNGQGDYYDNSGKLGYHIILGSSSYEIRRVTKFDKTDLNITQENSLGVHSYPSYGVIICEDDVWVEGTINSQKVTIIAADPEAGVSQEKRIIVPASIKYTKYDGTDKIGLVTQTDILLTSNIPTNMEIDAAMIAQNGQIRINDFNEIKNHIKVYGSMAHNGGILWSYAQTNGTVVSGFKTTETDADPYNVLNPPPQFPLTGAYAILSWREQ